MNLALLNDLHTNFSKIHKDSSIRAVILSATQPEIMKKPVFSSGIDVMGLTGKLMECHEPDDVARKFLKMRELIFEFQAQATSIEACRKPVISAIDGACLGMAIDFMNMLRNKQHILVMMAPSKFVKM